MRYKRIFAVVVLLVCLGGQTWAQSKPATGIPAKATPVVHSPAISHGSGASSNIHSVNIILRQQMRQVQKDRKSGKLTEAQAKAAWENLKSIRLQELEYFKQNGQKEVTSEQKSQLTGVLNQNAGSI
jgi:hypothetical protein